MKKKIRVLIVLSLIVLIALTGCTAGFFRSVSFGMSRDEVLSAETGFGEPEKILDQESYLYNEVPFLNVGGDLIYGFDEADTLQSIIFYAYPEYYTDEIYDEFIIQLKESYPGYDENITPPSDDSLRWQIDESDVMLTVQYKKDVYLLVRFEPIVTTDDTDDSTSS